MNIIKGLILKDLLQLKTYKRTLIIYVCVFLLSSLSLNSNIENMLVIMLTFGFGMFAVTSFNYDEFNKADRYILTLPLTKRDIVLSKYIFIILSTFIGLFIGLILTFIISFISSKNIPNIHNIINISISALLSVGFILSIQIPCIFKYGAEKGRILMIILTIFTVSILYLLANSNINLYIFKNILPFILVLLHILIYYISYKVSYKIYNNREL